MTDTTEGRATWDREVATAHGRARAAAAALTGMALAHLYLAAVGEWRVGLTRGGSGELADTLFSVGQTGQGLLHLVTAVLFLRWLSKSVNVAHLLQISPPLSWTGSQACWGFFIPFVNLVRPYQVIRDLHDRLAPDGVPEPLPRPRSDGVGGYRRMEMEKAPPPARLPHASIGAWWGLYVLGAWVAWLFAWILGSTAGQTVRLQILLVHGVEVGSAMLAVLVVRSIDGRLAERHRRLHHASDEELEEWGVTPWNPLVKTQTRVRTRHDEWIKRALQLWLGALGDVQLNARIAGESRHGDVLYTERRKRPAHRRKLGMLGDLARGIILFEVFRNPLTADGLTSCVLKVIELAAQQQRAARREKNKKRAPPASLCLITPSMSADLRVAAEATLLDAGRPGLYRLAPIWRTAVVVVNELPTDRSTSWLRLLGREKVQAAAVKELMQMSRRDPLRDATMQLLGEWQDSLPPPAQLTEDERELKMNLDQWYSEGEAKGEARGKAEGKAEDVLAVLEVRGVPVSAAQRRQVLACTDKAKLDAWVRAAVTTTSAKALLSGNAPR